LSGARVWLGCAARSVHVYRSVVCVCVCGDREDVERPSLWIGRRCTLVSCLKPYGSSVPAYLNVPIGTLGRPGGQADVVDGLDDVLRHVIQSLLVR
jgi:hypothetical protein